MKKERDKRYDRFEDEEELSVRPKNRVMCPDCGKSKMLFETEKKAENFIKWNGDKLDTTHNVLRAYYCPACCGWHISHKHYRESYDSHTDNMIQAYRENQKKPTRIDKIVREKEFAAKIMLTERQAKEIFEDMPLNVKRSTAKGTIRRYVSRYLYEHDIQEDQELRLAIYKLWREQYE